MKFKVYADPGHAWCAVKRSFLRQLGLLGKVSSFSYQKGNTVYLEEDCDLSLLVNELKIREISFEFIEKHTNRQSPVRSYDRFYLT